MHHRNAQPARRAARALPLGLLATLAPLTLGSSPAAAMHASASVVRTSSQTSHATRAFAARTISLNESGRLGLTSKHGFTLNEKGPGSGTVAGTIYVRLQIVSTSRVTAEVSIVTRGGSISGNATAAYHRAKTSASFSGSLTITRGTGSYAHAHGTGLSFSGTIQRSNDAITVHVGGTVSE